MSSRLHRLIYVSRWTNGLGDDVPAALHRIVAVSMASNRTIDVTGLLLAHEGWFIQVLEGPSAEISGLMGRISRDPRHREVHTLSAGPAERRLFSDWDMAGARLGPEADPILIELGQIARFDGGGLNADAALQLLVFAADHRRASEREALGLARRIA
jgi:hypothetical protein